ncbi:hypothetical protein ACHWQZ_G000253 [Mnemiopsis leidyi]
MMLDVKKLRKDTGGMSQATQYEQDYSELSADITAKIGRIPSLFGKDKHDMVGEVEGLLEEAKDLIDQIEVESHAASGDARKQVLLPFLEFTVVVDGFLAQFAYAINYVER